MLFIVFSKRLRHERINDIFSIKGELFCGEYFVVVSKESLKSAEKY